MDEEQWIQWSRRLLSIAQTGLHYSKNDGERERYIGVRDIALDIINSYQSETVDTKYMGLDQLIGYATPQVTVRGIVLKDNKILLVREKKHNVWNLPGGFADVGDSPREAIEREIREEAGISANAYDIIAILHNIKRQVFHQYAIYFMCNTKSNITDHIMQNNEINEIKLVDIDEVSKLELNKYLNLQWKRIKELIRKSNHKVEFD